MAKLSEIDIYGVNTIYISNDGYRLYDYFSYLLDIIATNLNCYKADFFRNTNNFGCDGINFSDTSNIKQVLEDIISNRVPASISINEVTIVENAVEVTMTGSFGTEKVTIELDEDDYTTFKIQKK